MVPLFSFSLNSLSFKIALYLKFSNFGLKFSGASLWNLLFLVYLLSIYIINKGPSKPLRENKFSKGNPKNLHYQFSILLFESRFKHTFQEQTKHTFIFIDYMCLWRSSMNAPKKEQNPVWKNYWMIEKKIVAREKNFVHGSPHVVKVSGIWENAIVICDGVGCI